MTVKVYLSLTSGLKEVKKRQQKILMILDSKNIKYDIIDISEPGKEEDKDFMQTNSTSKGGTASDPDPRHPLPPQVFNENEYCGDFEQFELANEIDNLEDFLKLPQEERPQVNKSTLDTSKIDENHPNGKVIEDDVKPEDENKENKTEDQEKSNEESIVNEPEKSTENDKAIEPNEIIEEETIKNQQNVIEEDATNEPESTRNENVDDETIGKQDSDQADQLIEELQTESKLENVDDDEPIVEETVKNQQNVIEEDATNEPESTRNENVDDETIGKQCSDQADQLIEELQTESKLKNVDDDEPIVEETVKNQQNVIEEDATNEPESTRNANADDEPIGNKGSVEEEQSIEESQIQSKLENLDSEKPETEQKSQEDGNIEEVVEDGEFGDEIVLENTPIKETPDDNKPLSATEPIAEEEEEEIDLEESKTNIEAAPKELTESEKLILSEQQAK